MKFSLIFGSLLVVAGFILMGVASANPSFAVLNLNSGSPGNVVQTVSPIESSTAQQFTFNQVVSGSSQTSYTVQQSWSNVEVFAGQTVQFGIAFPSGTYQGGIEGTFLSTGTITAVYHEGSYSKTWSYSFNAKSGSSTPYSTVNPSFTASPGNYKGTVSLDLTVTADPNYGWTASLPSGSVYSTSYSAGIALGVASQPSTQSFGIFGFTYTPASISFSGMLSSNVLSFTLDWSSTQKISIKYNGNSGSGTSGSFTNSPPTATSVVTNIQNQDGSSYTVTLSLSDIKYENTQTGITNAGHFYIDTGSQWVKVTPTSVIKISVSSFPTNISFAYVEDNGSTSGASYAYIIAAGLQYSIPFQNSTQISGSTAYETSITFQTAGNYTVNGFLESSTTGGGSLQLMSFTWNTGSGSGTGGSANGPASQQGLNLTTFGTGVGILALGGLILWRRPF